MGLYLSTVQIGQTLRPPPRVRRGDQTGGFRSHRSPNSKGVCHASFQAVFVRTLLRPFGRRAVRGSGSDPGRRDGLYRRVRTSGAATGPTGRQRPPVSTPIRASKTFRASSGALFFWRPQRGDRRTVASGRRRSHESRRAELRTGPPSRTPSRCNCPHRAMGRRPGSSTP